MKTVILVPRRSDNGHRDQVWEWAKAWWSSEFPKWPLFEGHHDEGLFNRSAAVNRAAALAGDWDVAVLIDADVVCDAAHVREAVAIAHAEQNRLVIPFTRRHNLNRRGSTLIMGGEKGSWRPFIAITYNQQCSAVVVIPRALWDQVGGFDERFEGWGFEDNAFASACETFGTSLQQLDGELWHLWHPPAGTRHSPSFRANRARNEMYSAAMGDKDAIHRLAKGEDVVQVPIREHENIPRILHRTVPAQTSEEIEGYWRRFGELHPGWTLLTHRDPLDPNDWPLTGRYWAKCESGAQKADLIRLEALHRWGGIYVDSDCEPYRSLEPLLPLRAFAAWEDERAIPNAVMGAEPEHPAIKACIDLAIRRLPRGTWAAGVGVTTQVFKDRSDVLLLPPGAFYPYHYKAKELRNRDHAKEQPWAFMAHHWAGSWLPENKAENKAEPEAEPPAAKLSFLIPFRDVDGTRTRAHEWMLRRWQHFYPDAEFCVASDDGVDPFNKSLAVNNAAKQATGDIFAILDADSWVQPEYVNKAIDAIRSGKAPWVVPIRRSYRLRQDVSDQIMALDPSAELPALRSRDAEAVGPVVGFMHIMPRAAFEAVHGMDERIRGWGGEDTSFVRAMSVVNGQPMRLSGTVMSLWHDRPRDQHRHRIWVGQDRDQEQEKKAIVARYAMARNREAMLRVLER